MSWACTRTYIIMYTYIHTYMYVYIVCTYRQSCACVCLCGGQFPTGPAVWVERDMSAYCPPYTCMYIHVWTYVHTFICIHTYMLLCTSLMCNTEYNIIIHNMHMNKVHTYIPTRAPLLCLLYGF